MAQVSLCVDYIVLFLVEVVIARLLYREECNYCATFGRIGNQLPYKEECDYCATFGRIGIISYPIGKSVTIVPLLVELFTLLGRV